MRGNLHAAGNVDDAAGTSRRWLIAILFISAGLRWILVAQGGQYFFGDEQRYDRGIALYQAIRRGEPAAVRAALSHPEHAGFVVLGAGVTAAQHLLAQVTPYGDWSRPENVVFTIKGAAAVLALFPVLNLVVLYAIVRAAGGSPRAANGAVLCLALANSAFYFSRHLLPYDAAISCALAAALVSARHRGGALRAGLGSGALAAAAYHVYNGYWFLVPVLGLVHVLAGERRQGWPRAAGFVAGAALGGGLPILAGFWLGGADYGRTMLAFSRTVTFGLFAEGWSFPWEYLAHTEGVFGVLVAGAIAAAWIVARRTGERVPGHVRAALLALAAAYGLLVLGSNALEKFVVYARTVKPLVVPVCIAGGWALAHLVPGRGARRGLVVAGLVAAGGSGFVPHFTMTFPAEVEIAVMRNLGNPKRALSFAGSLYFPVNLPVARPDLLLVDAQMLYPLRAPLPLPAGRELLRFPHPLQYRPFQYEAHSPRERALLRAFPPEIRLLQLPPGSGVPDDPPPALRYTAEDRPDGRR